MKINTLQTYKLGNLSVVSKNVSGDHYRGYFDILSDDKPITFALDSRFLKTERGIYSDFVRPSKALECSLHALSKLFDKYGNPIKAGKSSYLDIVLDVHNEDDNKLYVALLDFEEELIEKLVPCLKESSGSLKDYITRHCRTDSKIRGEIVTGFLRENYNKTNIKYVHLKVTKITKSFTRKRTVVDSDMLCYKTYKTMPVLRIDNVRIPTSRSENVRLNVHLCIDEQIVEACDSGTAYFDQLTKLLEE